jgi:hypothetical protein
LESVLVVGGEDALKRFVGFGMGLALGAEAHNVSEDVEDVHEADDVDRVLGLNRQR